MQLPISASSGHPLTTMFPLLQRWFWIRTLCGIAFALVTVLGTGLIGGWGEWYSPSPHYRHQTDSLLQGRLSLSQSPMDTAHDLTWSEGGVHQVWGLGVPIWRLPFEAIARVCGFPAFPDRLSLAAALALWAAIVLGLLSPARHPSETPETSHGRNSLIVGLILLCPVFVELFNSKFWVYEEAVAYEYLFGTGILVALLRHLRAPTFRGSVFIAVLAGLGPLIRPTLIFYGIGTVAALILVQPKARTLRGIIAVGLAFAMGPFLVLATNHLRFGHPMEFGHQLNLQHLFGSMYATRFDHPFAKEPLTSSARELIGLLFGTPALNDFDLYRQGFFPAQSPTVRWRNLYLRTYDVSWLVGMVAGAGFAARSIMFLRSSAPSGDRTRHQGVVTAAIWSLCATIPLCGFYLRNEVISSRYLIDFAPAFVAALSALILGFDLPVRSVNARTKAMRVAAYGFIVWIAVEGLLTQPLPPRPQALTYPEWLSIHNRQDHAPRLRVGSLSTGSMPIGSVAPDSVPPFHVPWDGIPHNGVGWNKVTGDTASVVILFVDDPQFIQVDVQPPVSTPHENPWVRAKLDRDVLPVTSLTRLPEGRIRLQFEVRKPQKKAQPQVLFLAFGPPETLDAPLSGYRLHTVSWK